MQYGWVKRLGAELQEVAKSLGISSDLIYRWRRQQRDNGELAFPGLGKMALTQDQKQIRELEKKLRDAELERDILKKAMAIFSRTSKWDTNSYGKTAAHFRWRRCAVLLIFPQADSIDGKIENSALGRKRTIGSVIGSVSSMSNTEKWLAVQWLQQISDRSQGLKAWGKIE